MPLSTSIYLTLNPTLTPTLTLTLNLTLTLTQGHQVSPGRADNLPPLILIFPQGL